MSEDNLKDKNWFEFVHIYREWLPKILRFFYLRTANKAVAEDLTQSAFLKAWRSFSENSRISFSSSWIYSIARNVLIDFWRKKKEVVFGDSSDIEEIFDLNVDVERAADIKRAIGKIQKAVNLLNDEQKEIILLKFFEGLSNEEIGQITGKSQTAIRSLQYRALMSLKNILGKENYF